MAGGMNAQVSSVLLCVFLLGVSTISRFWTAGALVGGSWSWYITQTRMTFTNWIASKRAVFTAVSK